jgi:Lar family restriction alleviation protein
MKWGKIPITLPRGPAACPFCDSDDLAQSFLNLANKRTWMITCNDCGAQVISIKSQDDVVLAWNRRPGGRP